MSKWGYMRISLDREVVIVAPKKEVVAEWFMHTYTHVKTILYKQPHGVGFKLMNAEEASLAYYALIEYLGSIGWEPFAVHSGNGLHLKRSTQE